MASSTLQGFVSALSSCFDLQGRSRDWCDDTATGNPVRADLVRRTLDNYRQLQISAGRRERSATPILPEDLRFMIQRMDQALIAALQDHKTTTSATLLRDMTFMLYLWNGGRRGQDALYVDWEDVHIRLADRSVVPVAELWSQTDPTAAPVLGPLVIVPSRTKTDQSRRPASQELRLNAEVELCAVRRLHSLYQWGVQQDRRAPTGAVFVSVRGSRSRLQSQAAGNRMHACLTQYGRYKGETMHSFRRGHIQAAQAADEPEATTMQRAGIVTLQTFRKYADSGRHLP